MPVCARAHRQTQRVLSKSAFHVFYKFLRIQSEHFLKRTVGSCAYAPGKARPRRFPAPHGTGRGLQTWAHPPQAAPLQASPSSPQPHGHQLSTYLLSESGSWPGTPSAEPPRRFPVIRRSTSTAAQGACPSGSRRSAHRAPDTPPHALAHSDGSCCGKHRRARGSQGPDRGGERQGSCSWRPGACCPSGRPGPLKPGSPSPPPQTAEQAACTQRLQHSGHLENHPESTTAAPAQ